MSSDDEDVGRELDVPPGRMTPTFSGQLLLNAWIVFTIFWAITFRLVLKRKTLHPVKSRSPSLLLITAISSYVLLTHSCFEIWYGFDNWPCFASFWLPYIVFPWFFLPYMVRITRLLFIFKVNVSKASGKTSWLIRNLKWFTQKFLMRIMYIFTGIAFIYGLIRLFVYPENQPGWYGCSASRTKLVSWSIFVVPLLAFVGFSIIALRKIRDEFNISNELKGVAAIWVFTVIPFLSLSFAGHRRTAQIFLALCPIGSYTISCAHPTLLTCITNQIIEFPSRSVLANLKSILKDPVATKYFKDFLVQEFSVENILFYLDVEDFKNLVEDEEIELTAQEIYNKYINSSSIFEINIDSNDKALIKRNLDDPDVDCFDEAQQSVFQLMESDSFPRFLKSTQCLDLIKQLHNQEDLYERLRQAKLI